MGQHTASERVSRNTTEHDTGFAHNRMRESPHSLILHVRWHQDEEILPSQISTDPSIRLCKSRPIHSPTSTYVHNQRLCHFDGMNVMGKKKEINVKLRVVRPY